MAVEVPFVIQTYQTRSIEQNNQKLINWFPELVSESAGGKKRYILLPTPGLKDFATVSGSEGRGIIEHKGVLYTVVANKLYSVNSAGTATELGTLSTSTGYVSMAAIQGSLALVDGTAGYYFTISTSTFGTITDVDFIDASPYITSLDGYFIVPGTSSDSFYISALNDPTNWAALDTASAQGNPDNLVATVNINRQLWLFGERSTEVWFDSGASFPFERIEGAFAEFGLAAKYSVAEADNTLIWLSQTKAGGLQVVKAEGFVPVPISTTAIAYQISTYSTVNDAEAFVYSDEGHEFYVLTFPTAQKTWVYDITMRLWHERSSTISGSANRWIPRKNVYVYGKHLAIAFNSGNIYEIDMDTYTDDGTAITRTLRSFPLHQAGNYTSIYALRLDVEKDTGAASGTETISLAISRDGGYNFDSALSVAAARDNEYISRVMWRSLGQARSWVFEFTTSDSIKWILLGIEIEPEPGTN